MLEDERGRRFTLRWQSEGIARLAERIGEREVPLADRTAAEALTNTRLFVPRSALPAAEADEYYLADLIGLRAEDQDGRVIGRVAVVHDYGAGTSLEITLDGGAPALILPFTARAVPVVDVPGGRIVVDPAGNHDRPNPRAKPPRTTGWRRGHELAHDRPHPVSRDVTRGRSAPPSRAARWKTGSGAWTRMTSANTASAVTGRWIDTPFGGGAGMVMRPDVIAAALAAHRPPGDGRATHLSHAARQTADPGRCDPLGCGAWPRSALRPL